MLYMSYLNKTEQGRCNAGKSLWRDERDGDGKIFEEIMAEKISNLMETKPT